MPDSNRHQPVLLHEALAALQIKADGVYVDATFGRGGHSRAILDKLGEQGVLLAMDKDPDAVSHAEKDFGNDDRFHISQGSFAAMGNMVTAMGYAQKVDGVLFDLGVSSPQLDNAARGFSFMHAGPLDMRMDTTRGETAAEWLAHASEQDIAIVLRDFGEERFHRRIARAVVQQRQLQPITTTNELAALIEAAVPKREKGKHPATRSFQAIRIYINRELDDLADGLRHAVSMLKAGGRLVVISFHSLEDRLVKRFIRDQSKGQEFPPDLPVQYVKTTGVLRAVGKAIRPGQDELTGNVRARSAIMRVAEKLAV